MATSPQQESNVPRLAEHFDEEGYEAYRTVSKAALLSLFFGVVSSIAFVFPVFLAVALLGIISGCVALRTIRRYPDEVSGWIPGVLGLVLGFGVLKSFKSRIDMRRLKKQLETKQVELEKLQSRSLQNLP